MTMIKRLAKSGLPFADAVYTQPLSVEEVAYAVSKRKYAHIWTHDKHCCCFCICLLSVKLSIDTLLKSYESLKLMMLTIYCALCSMLYV
jgi:hypothetical protein